jgi:hypothetical protein
MVSEKVALKAASMRTATVQTKALEKVLVWDVELEPSMAAVWDMELEPLVAAVWALATDTM